MLMNPLFFCSEKKVEGENGAERVDFGFSLEPGLSSALFPGPRSKDAFLFFPLLPILYTVLYSSIQQSVECHRKVFKCQS